MIVWRNLPIRSKLMASIMSVAGISLLLGLGINTFQEVRSYRKDLVRQARTQTNVIGEYCIPALDFGDREGARQILSRLHVHDQILAARLLDSENQPFASYGDDHVFAMISPHEMALFRDQQFFMSRPLTYRGQAFGVLQVCFSTHGLNERMRTQLRDVLLLFFVILGCAFAAAKLLQRAIQDPILHLVDVTHRLSEREDHSVRLQKRGDDEVGRLYDSFNHMMDAIERRERHLKNREENFRKVFNTQHDALFIHDIRGRIKDVNDRMCQMFGVTRDVAMKGEVVRDFSAPGNDVKRLVQRWRFVLDGEPQEFEWVAMRPNDRSAFDVQVNLQRIEHADGPAVLATVRDITMRKRMDQNLRASESRFRNLIEHFHDPVFLLKGKRLMLVNSQFREMFEFGPGRSDKEVFDLDSLIDPSDRDAYNSAMEQLHRGAVPQVRLELSIVLPGREPMAVDASFSHLDIEVGKALLGILRDVSERKGLEEQLRQVQKMEAVGRLAGGVAHDFNNILTVIDGYCDHLLTQSPLDVSVRRMIEQIQHSGQRAARLTRQLLAFSRKEVIQPKTIDVNREIGELRIMLTRLIGEHIEIHTVFEEDIHPVNMDLGQLEQVIMNIAVNARDAMPDGGVLTIETRNVQFDEAYLERHLPARPGPYVMIAISDTGIGMDAKTQERVFEPFFSTKEVGKGTGLGLSMVYGIIKQNEGYIWVYSEPGMGSTFKCYLPVPSIRTEEIQVDIESDVDLSGRETILIVEDHEPLREFLEAVFQDMGYKTFIAQHGQEALEIAKSLQRLDLLITDVVMPGMSGPKLAEEIKAQFPRTRTLFMSGYTGDEMIQQRILKRGVEFIQKPFNGKTLLQKVRTILD